MEKCSNCGLNSKYLYGPMNDLCNTCQTTLEHTVDPQINKEDTEQNKKERGDS